MDLLHKMKRALVAISTRINSRKSGGGVGRGGSTSTSDYGLLKLRDDVQMCAYKDVQVMWKILSGSQIDQQMANAAAAAKSETTVAQPLKRNKKRRPFGKLFFWNNHRGTSSLFS
ncbi:hypothetical protein RGQ29_006625 [Quercus rubra]|uniref:Uncharacterized protein n=1 Tax=Quercus rubra TaxID=3512 RepID=A0AAN7E7M6_QUERU|nr:hypothetical protein RGQ29_006625 [Quercus rubra]